jgi:hypothetical protein
MELNVTFNGKFIDAAVVGHFLDIPSTVPNFYEWHISHRASV